MRVTEGVLLNLYCPVLTIPSAQFTSTLVEQRSAINSDAQILRTISHSDVKESPFKFGQVPTGSVLSYQQKPLTYTGDIINHYVQQDFPELLLPEQHSHYNRVLNFAEHNLYLGMPLIELMLWN